MSSRPVAVGAPLRLVCVVLALVAAGCGGASSRGPERSGSGKGCPVDPVHVVVSVGQWGSIVTELGGACAEVTTILRSAAIDPHDYEPSPGDAALFAGAELVVLNGAGYDRWASKAVDATGGDPKVLDAAEVTDTPDGSNPHLWYDPAAVRAVADAVTRQLTGLAPGAAKVFSDARARFETSLAPYDASIARLRGAAERREITYAATETVFDPMATAIGLVRSTPPGFQQAATNGTEPAPGDVAAFRELLSERSVSVLVVNAQTSGAVPASLEDAARAADVPVVEVTESAPASAHGFVDWQVGQLDALATAVGA